MRLLIALILFMAIAASSARAAESFDNCSGYIDSVPATITLQGTWCLRADLSTAISSGIAIQIATNNVTIDCNHFKLGGLGAGLGTATVGMAALDRLNTTVRNCNVRGFLVGGMFTGGGHVIEDNRFEANRLMGISLAGDGNVVRRNLVVDTGGSGVSDMTVGIGSENGRVQVIDNVINGVTSAQASDVAIGVRFRNGSNSLVQGNYVTGLAGQLAPVLAGLYGINSQNAALRDNTVSVAAPGVLETYGVVCEGSSSCRCRDNMLLGTAIRMVACTDYGRNDHAP